MILKLVSNIFLKLYIESRKSYNLDYKYTDSIPEKEKLAFQEYSKQLTILNVKFMAFTLGILAIVLMPSDFLIFELGSIELKSILLWRAGVVFCCTCTFVGFHYSDIVARYPYEMIMLMLLAISGGTGYLVGTIGGLESPLTYGIYTIPLLTVLLIVPPLKRIIATTGLVAIFLITFVISNPEHINNPQFGIILVWLVAVISTMIAVGHVVYYLLRVNFLQRFILDRRVYQQTQTLRDNAKALISIQEKERARIGRDIHDGLGQILAGLRFETDRLQIIVNQYPVDAEKIGKGLILSHQLLDSVHSSVDEIVSTLRPPILASMGLVSAIQRMVDDLKKWHGISCTITSPEHCNQLSEEKASAIYRIVQESLTNTIKHAEAKHISLRINVHDQHLHLEVSDDGKGFDSKAISKNDRFGLKGMLERTRWLQGHLEIDSTPGKGTTILLRVPLDE